MEPRISQVAQLYQNATPASPKLEQTSSDANFAQAVNNFASTMRANEAVATDAMLGKADPQALVEALTQTQVAVETAVNIRDKIVEAYQEILRMPV